MPILRRRIPNILVTGTQGVGKSYLCHELHDYLSLRWLEISSIIKDYEDFQHYGNVYYSIKQKVLDSVEGIVLKGGNIIDYHQVDFLPTNWIDVVFVLRVDEITHMNRLISSQHNPTDIADIVQSEISQKLLEEAKAIYGQKVHEINHITAEDFDNNVDIIKSWVQQWFKN